MSIINVDLSDTIASWRNKTNEIAQKQGDLSLLTDSASNLVSAINNLKGLHTNQDSDILALRTNVYGDSSGTVLDLSYLNTTEKGSIIGAVNELDRRISDVYDASGVLLNT